MITERILTWNDFDADLCKKISFLFRYMNGLRVGVGDPITINLLLMKSEKEITNNINEAIAFYDNLCRSLDFRIGFAALPKDFDDYIAEAYLVKRS